MTLIRIQNEVHAIQEILKPFLFQYRPAFSQTYLFLFEILMESYNFQGESY